MGGGHGQVARGGVGEYGDQVDGRRGGEKERRCQGFGAEVVEDAAREETAWPEPDCDFGGGGHWRSSTGKWVVFSCSVV